MISTSNNIAVELEANKFNVHFTLPENRVVGKREIAHRQTASTWLKELSGAGIVRPQKIGRTTYYINYKLMELLAEN